MRSCVRVGSGLQNFLYRHRWLLKTEADRKGTSKKEEDIQIHRREQKEEAKQDKRTKKKDENKGCNKEE